ncbi:hypothetical protein GGI15_003390 [Coemansia interrupta]|uniref:Ornithine decarboxylase antizyme n=1 Tax=Coemansia interrupta TaxID=1126814 RepID=A0A9W8HFF4_9FUNG|nr:hypothetical protein GGI15_003390 [Coemansia interrupta]
MMLFTLANHDASVSSDALSSVDDNKPNSIYGGSVQPAATTTTTTASLFDLHDLPASSSSMDSSMTEVFGESLLDTAEDSSDSSGGEYEESFYMLENATAAAHNLFPAECCVEQIRVVFLTGLGIVPSLAAAAVGVWGGRPGSLSSSSSDDDDAETTPAAPCVLLQEEFSLKLAADVQREVFPHGIPSQGVIKAGAACISASVLFRATACRPCVPWEGFIVDDVLFVRVPMFSASEAHFRTAVMALIELAEDVLGCASIMIAVPKSLGVSSSSADSSSSSSAAAAAAAASLVRAFMYSGFELVSPMLYQPSDAYVLLGYDAM